MRAMILIVSLPYGLLKQAQRLHVLIAQDVPVRQLVACLPIAPQLFIVLLLHVALGVANEVWMLENATYSILSPEGFASILF